MAKVTKNSTKDSIWAALQEANDKIKALQDTTVDFKKEAEVKKAEAVVKKADQIQNLSVSQVIADINAKIEIALNDVSNVIEDSLIQYEEVKEATNIKRKELTDLYGVSDELMNLAAIINTKNQVKEETAQAINDRAREEKEYNSALKTSRQREEDEYRYNTDKKRREFNDKFNDELIAKRKELAAEIEEVEDRELSVKAREITMTTLEATVAEIPKKIEEAVTKAVADKEKSMSTGFNIEKSYIKKEYESSIKVFETKIENLTERLEGANKIIDDLSNKLNQAYLEIKEMANKSVEATGNAKTIASMETMINKMSGSSK